MATGMKFLFPIDLTKNQLLNAVIQNLATEPASPKAGQIYFNTGSQKFFIGKVVEGTTVFTEVGVFYTLSVDDANGVKVRLSGTDSTTNDIEFVGSGSVTITKPSSNVIDISVPTSLATEESLTLTFDGGVIEGTDQYEFDGDTAKTIDFVGGTGITLAKSAGSITFNHSNSISSGTVSEGGSARTLANGESFNVPSVTFDTEGHITNTTTTQLTIPTYAAGTYITLTNNTFDHDSTTRSDSTSNASPAFAGTFNLVDSVTTNATGHVTGINVKTVTVPTETTLSLVDGGTGTWVTGASVSDHEITLTRSDSTDATITVGELIVSAAGAGSGDVTIAGNLTVNGTTTTINTATVEIEDNIIEINSNQTGTPSTSLIGGLEINRGDEANFQFVFVENTDDFRIGEIGDLQPVLTRDEAENFTNNDLLIWDNDNNRAVGSTPAELGIARKFAVTQAITANTSFDIAHNLNTSDITFSIKAGNDYVFADVAIKNNNEITVTFAEVNGITSVRIVVIG